MPIFRSFVTQDNDEPFVLHGVSGRNVSGYPRSEWVSWAYRDCEGQGEMEPGLSTDNDDLQG